MVFKDLYEVVFDELCTNTHIGGGTIFAELWSDIKDSPYKYGSYEVVCIGVDEEGILTVELESAEEDRKWLNERAWEVYANALKGDNN